MSRCARATIHLAALRSNLARVRELAPRSKVMAVVKADGYGHGLERVASALQGADALGVASIADGQRIRASGLSNRIVVLSGIDEPADIDTMRRLNLDSVIHHESQLQWLESDPGAGALRVWLKVDTGMHRLGFPVAAAAEAYARLRRIAWIDPQVVLMTHFANSDQVGDPLTAAQIAGFSRLAQGLPPAACSLSNSAGLVAFPDAHADWVRVGGLLYGISLLPQTALDLGFHAAMTLSTKLIAINRIDKGERIGYGQTWECPETMSVGVAAIGYGDGYPRQAPAGTPVLVRGRPVPLIGRVSMDLITLDLRDLPDAQIGDPVVLWGGGLPVERVAQASGTIGYELVCGMTRRVEFVEDHQSL